MSLGKVQACLYAPCCYEPQNMRELSTGMAYGFWWEVCAVSTSVDMYALSETLMQLNGSNLDPFPKP